MKLLRCFFCSCILLAAISIKTNAANVFGVVVCDADQNQVVDTNDIGIPGVLVVITNQSGSFSNSVVTGADGSFNIEIPNFDPLGEVQDPLSQVYVETLSPATVPTGSTIIMPVAITNLSSTPAYYIDFAADQTTLLFTDATGQSSSGYWLLNNPECQAGAGCQLEGCGKVRECRGSHNEHEFGGMICSDCSSNSGPCGFWTDCAHELKLEFCSTVITNVQCGEVQKTCGSVTVTIKTIEFSGCGILKDKKGRKEHCCPVYFTAYCVDNGATRVPCDSEDHGKGKGKDHDKDKDHGKPKKPCITPCPDGYYLRVCDGNGVTLMLVSGDCSNPSDIAPVCISKGDLDIH
jgi:hypothetical protein